MALEESYQYFNNMDFFIQNTKVCQESLLWKNGMIEIEVDKQDFINESLGKVNILIKLTSNRQIQYLKDGAILRIDQLMYSDSNPNLLNNYDQIKYLKFEGQYGLDCKKFGKWKTIWNGEVLKELGGYYQNGLKQGLWKELIRNYQSLAKVYEKGAYLNGQKYGMWNYIYKNQNIGGGFYNEQLKKKGKWIELSEGFCNMSQITYKGEYHKCKKIGIWNIYFLKELIGGGLYDSNGIKEGKWIELSERSCSHSQITYKGQYKNGKPIGIWSTWIRREYQKDFEQICNGQYDQNGEGKKIGMWIELIEMFKEDSQVTYSGQYKDGNKTGRWDIFFEKEAIGGGTYDEGSGIKIGNWVEVCDKFDNLTQVTQNGQYKNGNKVGKWDILFEEEVIGGGTYDEGDEGIKIGNWIELSDEFWRDSQVLCKGNYKNGNKSGRWDIEHEFEQCGGGSYDEKGEGIKLGEWIELSDSFNSGSEVIYKGEYKNGVKVGRWNIKYREKKIGGGSYDEKGQGIKIGNWIEVIDGFSFGSEITYDGQYKNGIKVGTWVEMNKMNDWSRKEMIYDD
ncbi:unnamed protein product [Paramecium sonneborni]|uniref:Uncharacterized protein n=1 Tax=Paramecium sonneborni TaxID=65129 RepID=A0A8S1NBP2_9CILI|nr:unnamed protein product [Paramecium sonneborni]